MTIEKMDELIEKWETQKEDYLRKMNKKISDMQAKRDLEMATQLVKEFHRKNVSPQTVRNMRKASKEEIERSFGNRKDEKND
jgi:TolA-binding protein